ncbi:MAG: o-succinylbenzoate synthase [Actinobacteria bacterium]|nr:o-succinylbenzoate synthase [Actinomycetota bacterium]
MPELAHLVSAARVVSLPLRTKFRGLNDREMVLFEGPNGWAEWSPFVEYEAEEAAAWLAAAIEFAYGNLPTLNRKSIPVNATLPAVAPDQVAKVLGRFGSFKTVKIKVAEKGQTTTDDLARIAQVMELYPHAKIRLDANGGYQVDEALELSKELVKRSVPLEYLEQPVQSIAEMAELRLKLDELGVKIAADESVRKVSDPLAVAHANAADVLILKAAPLGGIAPAIQIAREAGLPVVISSALESSVGLSMGAHLAAALPDLEFDCGLATAALLAGDVTRNPLMPVDGQIEVRRVEVDEELLNTFKTDEHREDWWLERLEACYKLL